MGTLKDIFKIALWPIVDLASGRTLNRHDGSLHLRPVHLDTGKGHPCTLYARRALHSFNSGQGVTEPLDQAKVALGEDEGRRHGSRGPTRRQGPPQAGAIF